MNDTQKKEFITVNADEMLVGSLSASDVGRTNSEHAFPVGVMTEAMVVDKIEHVLRSQPLLFEYRSTFIHAAKLVAMLEEENAKQNKRSRNTKQQRAESEHNIEAELALNDNLSSSASSIDMNSAVLQRAVQDGSFDEAEISALHDEVHHRWQQPKLLYFLCFVNAMAAIVQGMDETVVNGAQIFYFDELNLNNTWLQGLVNAAPYLACALISVWLTAPLNDCLGRRGTIFIMCILAAATSVWEGVCNSWENLFLARFFLGVSIGAKSTTVPMYSSECAPTGIRGALTSLWQMFTAFGIFLGYLVDVALVDLPPNVNWRWMLGSSAVAPVIVLLLVYVPPESPRWLMKQERYHDAFHALLRLRNHQLIAARDFLLLYLTLQDTANKPQAKFVDLTKSTRNIRAVQSSFLLMLLQQFCGVNVIMYYSSQIFVSAAGVSESTAIYSSLGAGLINFLFAIPSVFLIDRWGRRPLVLATFPLLSIFLFFTGLSFFVSDSQTKLILISCGIYLYMAAYSIGEGPVPFTYAAEAFPLEIRDSGMSAAVAVTWFFSFLLSMLWPSMLLAFQPAGAFAFYGTCCAVGVVFIYFIVPETKGVPLEELDEVFSEPLSKFARSKWNELLNAVFLLKSSLRDCVFYRPPSASYSAYGNSTCSNDGLCGKPGSIIDKEKMIEDVSPGDDFASFISPKSTSSLSQATLSEPQLGI